MRRPADHPGGPLARALAVVAGLFIAVSVSGQSGAPRLLVIDLPYARVWSSTVRAVEETCPVTRAEGGVIECARVERPPRADESGLERVADRVVVRVEAVASLTTRVTVDVQAEGLRGGRWEPTDGGVTAQSVLARIRAAQG